MRHFLRWSSTLSVAGLCFTSISLGQMQVTDNFNTNSDGRWEGLNNRTDPQSYGFSPTDNTGSTVNPPAGTASGGGEIGGIITRDQEPQNFYGFNVGTISFNQPHSYSGVFRVVNAEGGGGLRFGYFAGADSYDAEEGIGFPPDAGEAENFLGFFLNDGTEFRPEIYSTISNKDSIVAQSFVIAEGTTYAFSASYDPANTSITYTLGTGEGTPTSVTHDFPAGFMGIMDDFTRFGFFPVSRDGDALEVYFDDLTFTSENPVPAGLLGDFNNDQVVDATDIDLLCDRINAGTGEVELFDVNNDGSVNQADVVFEVEEILDTKFGDTDTDGDVDLNDLGNLASGFGQPGEKRWSRGNFDCDLDVDLPDLGTLATNFDAGRGAALAAFEALVPEPASLSVLGFAGMLAMRGARRGRG